MFLQVSVVLFWGVPGPGGCLVRGVPGPGGGVGCLLGGVWSGGAWWSLPRTATAADGTHPNGMHSCYNL